MNDILDTWFPNYPRRFGNPRQSWVFNQDELLQRIEENNGNSSCYASVHHFLVHPKNGGIPPIDTVLFDIDADFDRHDINSRRNALIYTIRQSQALVDVLYCILHITPRILLTGFKGLQIFIDVETMYFKTQKEAKAAITALIKNISDIVFASHGIRIEYDTAVVGDLSRLCRIPNTVHPQASHLLDHTQYAVPISISELFDLTVDRYDAYCENPRYNVNIKRNVYNGRWLMFRELGAPKGGIKRNCYIGIRPCFDAACREKKQLNKSDGHFFRIIAVNELFAVGYSHDEIIAWFNFCDDYSEEKTTEYVNSLLLNPHPPSPCANIISRAGRFCLKEKCENYA